MTDVRTRREPPPFRRVEVARVEPRSPRLVRLTLIGADLAGLDIGLPAASVRLLVPPADTGESVSSGESGRGEIALPTWNGNEFLHADGSRPPIRTVTPIRFDPDALELDVEVVLHGDGPLSRWAAAAAPGSRAAVSGTGRGYTIDPAARDILLAGDESALPAIGVLFDALPRGATVQVIVETAGPDARIGLSHHPGLIERWVVATAGAPPGDALVAAVEESDISDDTRVWAAGEAAAVWRIRRHLFDRLGLPRSHAVVRGYWKVGRGGDVEGGSDRT